MVSRLELLCSILLFAIIISVAGCFDNPVIDEPEDPPQNQYLDTQPPDASIVDPGDGELVYGSVTITADVHDNIGVDHVEFYLDGRMLNNGYDDSVPFEVEWDTSGLSDSTTCDLYVKAYDTSLNFAMSDTITVTVYNSTPPPVDTQPPSVTIETPTEGDIVSGTVLITAVASDNVTIERVDFYIDGVIPGNSTEYHAPYEHSWETSGLEAGSVHTIAARAIDSSGNVAYSDTVHVSIAAQTPPPADTEPPVVSITNPADGDELSGIVTITCDAADNVGVARVDFYMDESLLSGGSDTSAPYQYELNATVYTDGSSHIITARAIDSSGNDAQSAPVQVVVQNKAPDTVPPTVSVQSPQNESIVSGVVHIVADASDDVAVDHVDFLIDGVIPDGSTEYNPPYEHFWDTATLEEGSNHTITARATDTAGNWSESAAIHVTLESSSGDPGAVILNEDLTARQVFPTDNWWNLDISGAPVDGNSNGFISFIGESRSLHADFGGEPYGIPYVTVSGDQPLRIVYFYSYGGESDDGAPGRPPGYPIPDEAHLSDGYIEGGQAGGGNSGDRHLLVIDRERWLLFELFGTHWDAAEQRWEAASGAVFNLATNDRRPEGWTSTDAAGLAVFPGLIRYDEVYGNGEIEHALRFTVRASNGYVWPASHAAGSTQGAPPMGMRMRLKASFDISGYAAPVQKILRAMKKYGLIVADNGSDMYIQGTMDNRWDIGLINGVFHTMQADDFEVIELGWDPVNN